MSLPLGVVVDPGTAQIRHLFDPHVFDEVDETIRLGLKRDIEATLPFPDPRLEYDALTATPLIHRHRDYVEHRAVELAQRFGPVQWLWYLRRLPCYVFEGEYKTTLPYDSALAELVSSKSRMPGAPIQDPTSGIMYPVSADVLRSVYELCAITRYLSQLHGALRWAGKGSSFGRTSRFLPLDWTPARDLEGDVELFDRRVEAGSHFFAQAGTILDDHAFETKQTSMLPFLLIARTEPHIREVPVDILGGVGSPRVSAELAFGMNLLRMEELARLEADYRLTRTEWRKPWFGALLGLLATAAMLILRRPERAIALFQRGYVLEAENELVPLMNGLLPLVRKHVKATLESLDIPTSAKDLLDTLASIPLPLYPLSAPPPVRKEGRLVCVDVAGATRTLQRSIELGMGGGEVVNARAEHFELATQAVLDRSRWKPSPSSRDLRGRTPRLDGRGITDIDALGELGDELLLVSCKSRVYSDAYDAGKYAVVRNGASEIEGAVAEWAATIARLSARRVGDNYDFSRYRRIFGVVCTPMPVFVRAGAATRLVEPGLLAACSIRELELWAEGSVQA